MTAWQ